jgi:hypothetical protein
MSPSRSRGWLGALAFLGAFVMIPADAANLTGTELLSECSAAPGSATHKQCVSYIAGVVDGIDTLMTSLRLLHPFNSAYPQLYCLPPRIAATSLVAPTVDYLVKHPATRQYGASSEILLALKQAYPCTGS